MNYGKHICKTLKAIRSEIASANGIDYTPIKCDHKGDCAGTCPACESEMRWLERQLINRKSLGKAVAIVGLSLALSGTAYAATPQNKKNLPQRPVRPGGSGGMNRPPQRTAGVVRRPEQPKDPIRPIPPGKGRPPKKDNNTTNSDSIYTTVDHAATFPGGDEALGLFIKQHLSVPESILAPIKEKNGIFK